MDKIMRARFTTTDNGKTYELTTDDAQVRWLKLFKSIDRRAALSARLVGSALLVEYRIVDHDGGRRYILRFAKGTYKRIKEETSVRRNVS